MRSTRISLFVLAIVAAWMASVAPASATGSYQVYSCRTPAGLPAPTDGWSTILGHEAVTADNCNAADARDLDAQTLDQRAMVGDFAGWRYSAPQNLTLGPLSFWRYTVVSHHDLDNATGQWSSWISLGSPEHAAAVERCDLDCTGLGSAEDRNLLAGNRFDVAPPPGTRDAYVVAGCIGTPGYGCNVLHDQVGNRTGYARYDVQALQAELEDSFAPVAQDVSGSLTIDDVLKGAASLSFAASDKGGGLYHVWIDVKQGDGAWTTASRQIVDPNDGKCQELDYLTDTDREFGFQVPCKLAATVTASLDTRKLADGEYDVRAMVEDAAGNTTPVLAPRHVAIDNVPPPQLLATPTISGTTKLGATLTAGTGVWSGTGNKYAYRWLRCTAADLEGCAAIAGSTGSTYQPTVEDLGRVLRVEVTASNAEGTSTAASDSVGPVRNANGVIPACADGIDNDHDGKIDTDDPGCASRAGTTEVESATTPSGGNDPVPHSGVTGVGNGGNASANAVLSLSGPRKLRLAFRKTGSTRITLRDEKGRAISGAAIQVLQRMNVPGAQFAAVHAPIITDADGHVRYLIEAGYSRTLRFAYAPLLGGPATIVRDIQITVPSKTTFRTNKRFLRNGQTVRFIGRLQSLPAPTGGVVIDLQARVGQRWQTFNSLRTNSAGKWHAKYRFHATTGLQTYTFRARVRRDTGFPYAPSISRRVKVKVRG